MRPGRQLLFLPGLAPYASIGLLLLRALTGAFLVYGVIDNVVSPARMEEFSAFLAANGFPSPDLMAPFSVYVQLLCGLTLGAGLLTRWTGIVIAVHFAIALAMVHWQQDFRGWWPAIVLVAIGAQFALTGGGRLSLDQWLERSEVR